MSKPPFSSLRRAFVRSGGDTNSANNQDSQPHERRTSKHRSSTDVQKRDNGQQRPIRNKHELAKLQSLAEMRLFKRMFHGKETATFQIRPEAEGCTVPQSVRYGTLAEVSEELLTANMKGAAIGMVVNTTDGRGRKASNATEINAIYIDCDGNLSPTELKHVHPEPDIILRTSKGRGHAMWLTKGLSVSDFKRVQRALAAKFGTDPSVSDPARAMRMPGTIHHKNKPQRCKVIYVNSHPKPRNIKSLLRELGVSPESKDQTQQKQPDGERVPATSEHVASALAAIPPMDLREDWLRVVMAVRSAMPNETGEQLAAAWSSKSIKFNEDDQRRTWGSLKQDGGVTAASLFALAAQHGWKNPGFGLDEERLPIDDFEVLDAFAEAMRAVLCYDQDMKTWLLFKQPVWHDDLGLVEKATRSFVQDLLRKAKDAKDAAAMKAVGSYNNMGGVRGLLRDAAGHHRLTVKTPVFDVNANLFAVSNGVIDLRNQSFRLGIAEDYLVRQAPVEYEHHASCPRFLEFLHFATRGDNEYMNFLQRALGYTLFGHANEQGWFIVYGPSGNGKGTLFRLIEKVMGPYVTAVAPNLLNNAYGGNPQSPTPALMALRAARMLQCGEGQDRKPLDTAFIKQLTGNDLFTARSMYGGLVQFTPVGKLWLSCNQLPEVPSNDEAMWRRITVLPFKAKIKVRDSKYESAMAEELPGILNWLVAGAAKYAQGGLGSCGAVDAATEAARKECDTVGLWTGGECIVDRKGSIQSKVAYLAYKRFCKDADRMPLSDRAFFASMERHGFKRGKTKHFNRYLGLRLRDE